MQNSFLPIIYLSSYFPNLPFPDSTHTLTYPGFLHPNIQSVREEVCKIGFGGREWHSLPSPGVTFGWNQRQAQGWAYKSRRYDSHSLLSQLLPDRPCSFFSEGRHWQSEEDHLQATGWQGFLCMEWVGGVWGELEEWEKCGGMAEPPHA